MRQIVLGLVLVGGQFISTARTESVAANVREFPSVTTRFWVAQAIQGASKRLRKPECTRVLSDFTNVDGHPLLERLEKLGVSADEYVLRDLLFYEGKGQRWCNPLLEREAVTERGSRVVFICSDRFIADTYEREIVIIHEMLHSLGLGENPPSSREITDRVMARCGKA